ncbi:MAG TPA: RnfABCDGE type electron transport complex subunit D, partial [Paludibacter sp.]|nr:RnfABCDGE type electron transport complex subunit D [Paludibacter sp.]
MSALKNIIDRLKPHFDKGGKLEKFHSVFDGFETFLFVPDTTSKSGTHIHDAVDSKRTMIIVVVALVPALLFGMYNVGYQHYLAIGQTVGFWNEFLFGFLAVLPFIIVSYVVGLGIEFTVAQLKGQEINEGFLVTGFLIPLIIPVDTPLWMVAVATAFAVIFAKEVFGGTGMNIFNVALVARAFLFFAYPTFMSGDKVWVRTGSTFGLGAGQVVDSFSGATPLGQISTASQHLTSITGTLGNQLGFMDGFLGFIPGSVGETSVVAILIGAALLLITGVGSWKTMLAVLAGGTAMALVFNHIGPDTASAHFPWYNHLVFG